MFIIAMQKKIQGKKWCQKSVGNRNHHSVNVDLRWHL